MRRTHQSKGRNSRDAGVSGQAMKRVVLLLTLVATISAAPAQAASRLVVKGAGFGHGVGMSQYGAHGFALQGADHEAILRHYYTGTQIGTLENSSSQVRVLLKTASRIVFTNAAGIAGGRKLEPGRRYIATRGLSGVVHLRSASGRDLGSYGSPLAITGAGGGVQVNGRSGNAARNGRYRGNLLLHASALGGISAINALGIDDYIRGVVAGEMPSGWPQAALRAQAVAARTYALATSKNGDGFDQYADTRSQVYNGISGETATTDEAVAATAGEVVSYAGKPIVTYYFSTSGGRTEDVENSFLGAEPAPYLRSVEDPYDNASPRHRWTKRMSLHSAQRRLGRLVQGRLQRIKVLSRGKSPRVVRAQIVGSGGRTNVSGPTLRSKLGLYDTWARFTVITAGAQRGDGNAPSTPASPTGGAQPRVVRAASSNTRTGTIVGRVDTGIAGIGWVSVQRWNGKRWMEQFDVPAGPGGRYAGRVRAPGLYRVVYRGAVGPSVLVR
ncbi:MAG TPA: SpoIID/LytB domain-containing protein [Solirubrobacteraceae bacterium]|nr:SpoIID/LytB domain-containing protein [Solirubrobacteraceae bacterium]